MKITTKELRDYISETVRDELIQNNVFPKRIFEHSYVTGVLGLSVPLNESYPYSDRFCDLIIQEQLLLEGFFGDFKKLAGDIKNAALSLRYIMSDPSRIKTYVGILLKTIQEQYQKAVEWIKKVVESCEALNTFAKSVADFASKVMDFITKVVDKVKAFVDGIKSKIVAVIKKVQGMAGWKQALLASATCVGIAFIWKKLSEQNEVQKQLGDIKKKAEDAKPLIEKAKAFFSKNKGALKKVSFESAAYQAPALVDAIYGDVERVDEFFGGIFGKKKDKEDAPAEGGDEEAKGDEAKGEGGDEATGIVAKIKEVVKTIRDLIKEQILGWIKEQLDKAKDLLKGVAVSAITTAVGGGVMTLFKWMGKVFSGLKFVFEYLGPPLKKFAGIMKGDKEETPEAEAQEAMAGKDDPTESFRKDLPVLRAYVRQSLISSRAV